MDSGDEVAVKSKYTSNVVEKQKKKCVTIKGKKRKHEKAEIMEEVITKVMNTVNEGLRSQKRC